MICGYCGKRGFELVTELMHRHWPECPDKPKNDAERAWRQARIRGQAEGLRRPPPRLRGARGVARDGRASPGGGGRMRCWTIYWREARGDWMATGHRLSDLATAEKVAACLYAPLCGRENEIREEEEPAARIAHAPAQRGEIKASEDRCDECGVAGGGRGQGICRNCQQHEAEAEVDRNL